MFPLRDINPTKSFPVVTVGIIGVCIGVFIYQFVTGVDATAFSLGFIPARLSGSPLDFSPLNLPAKYTADAFPPLLTLFTSIFMHGGLLHLIGNMWFLWIFGDNVEDVMGRLSYLVFYLLCGVLASLAHFLTDTKSILPLVGASGAISGVMGAYILLFPKARIATLIIFGFFARIVNLPALVVIGMWIVFQLLYGFGSLGGEGGGVAYFAHIGGFAAGLLFFRYFIPKNFLAARRIRRVDGWD
ncbi:MAG: rhomboid family intramembrane serine protease [Myxococcota bacterium]